eukprot:5666523-Lingulodinium_polyedra.AAC.1
MPAIGAVARCSVFGVAGRPAAPPGGVGSASGPFAVAVATPAAAWLPVRHVASASDAPIWGWGISSKLEPL